MTKAIASFLRKEVVLRSYLLCLQCCMAGNYSPCLLKKELSISFYLRFL